MRRKRIRLHPADALAASYAEQSQQPEPKSFNMIVFLIHIVLVVITAGLWLLPWGVIWLGGSIRSATVVLALILAGLIYLF